MKFYVYQLIDPRDGKPFYVGKGKGNRISAHETEAKRGVRGAKCNRIREIWLDGLSVDRSVVQWFECEDEAYAFEAQMILDIGLENLTNVIPGGSGGFEAYKRQLKDVAAKKITPRVAKAIIVLMGMSNGFTSAVMWKWSEAKINMNLTEVAQKWFDMWLSEWGESEVLEFCRHNGVSVRLARAC